MASTETQVAPLTETKAAEKPPVIKAFTEETPRVETAEVKLAPGPSSKHPDPQLEDAAGYGAVGASSTGSADLTKVLGAATGFEAAGATHTTTATLEVNVHISMHA